MVMKDIKELTVKNLFTPLRKSALTTFQLHCASLNIHGKVFQIHWTRQNESQPVSKIKLHPKYIL